MKKNTELSKSIQDKHIEIHYNQKCIRSQDGKTVPINMQGKIKCPVINQSISSIVCAKLMDKKGWPRELDPEICKRCSCFIYLSIKKFSEIKKRN